MSQARTFPNDTASVREARRYVLEVLGAIAQPVADAIALMVSELATNAVRHTSSRFTVVADRTEEQIRVAITDDGSGSPVVRAPAAGRHFGPRLADRRGTCQRMGSSSLG